jgi:Transposase DDE domain/Transposase domain (DUF772)
MQTTLRQRLEQFSHLNQTQLFEFLQQQAGVLSDKMRLLVSSLGMLSLSRLLPPTRGWKGRPAEDRQALATAFLAKAILGLQTTRQLLDRLQVDRTLRSLCGWNSAGAVPHESTFSRAFAEFSQSELPQQLHQVLIQNTYQKDTPQDQLVGHITRDSTAIEVRERFPEQTEQRAARQRKHAHKKPTRINKQRARKQLAPQPIAKRKRGRPKKSERALSGKRLPRQRRQTLAEMLAELPRSCDIGAKKNSKGHTQYWRGYKLHIDVADGQIPISCLLTAASLHDSQVAIPLATITAQRVTSLYDLMDAAYDAQDIREHCESLGHVPLIDPVHRAVPIPHRTQQDSLRGYDKRRTLPKTTPGKIPPFTSAQEERYKIRTMSERVNGRLKDEFGGRTTRVRGATKVMAHLMFGIIALTVDQLLRLTG